MQNLSTEQAGKQIEDILSGNEVLEHTPAPKESEGLTVEEAAKIIEALDEESEQASKPEPEAEPEAEAPDVEPAPHPMRADIALSLENYNREVDRFNQKWGSMRASNPGEAAALRMERTAEEQVLADKLAVIKQAEQRVLEDEQAQYIEKATKWRARELSKLKARIPDFDKQKPAIREYLKSKGYTETEINLANSRDIEFAYNAMTREKGITKPKIQLRNIKEKGDSLLAKQLRAKNARPGSLEEASVYLERMLG